MVQCLLSGIPPAGLNGGFVNLRAQGDAVCQALVATQEDVVEAKNKLKKTEKQLEATQATQIDEEAPSTLNELFDKLVQAHKNYDYKISPRCARRLCANAQSRGQDPRVDAACDILQVAGEKPLVNIMSGGGHVQLVSNLKGAGAERATYTVRVKPGASRLADMTCDCSLRLGTEYQIACVHIAKLVHDPAVQEQTTTIHKHQLLAGKVWPGRFGTPSIAKPCSRKSW